MNLDLLRYICMCLYIHYFACLANIWPAPKLQNYFYTETILKISALWYGKMFVWEIMLYKNVKNSEFALSIFCFIRTIALHQRNL